MSVSLQSGWSELLGVRGARLMGRAVRSATGVRTSYLSDLWVWDTLNYKWYQIEHSAVDRKPG